MTTPPSPIRRRRCWRTAVLLLVLISEYTTTGFGVRLRALNPSQAVTKLQLVHQHKADNDPNNTLTRSASRRRLLHGATAAVVAAGTLTLAPVNANALFGSNDRRQLEVCIVQILRVVYWATSAADDIQQAATPEKRKQRYLEARLGAKSLLTAKIGGGASARVYILASLQLPACLVDLQSYATMNRKVEDLRQDFYEALAAVVEFDGMETLKDASPRSALTLQMYTNDKAVYVQRLLRERVVVVGEQLVTA